MATSLGRPGALLGNGADPTSFSAASLVFLSCPVGTTQLLPAPPGGYVWCVARVVDWNFGAGAANVTIQDSDGPLCDQQAVAGAGVGGNAMFISDKAVEVVVALDGPVVISLLAYLAPAPELYVVFKPTGAFTTIPIVVPAGKIAVPWNSQSVHESYVNTTGITNQSFQRACNADTAAAQSTTLRLTRGAVVSGLRSVSNTKSTSTMNNNPITWAYTAFGPADVFEGMQAAPPAVAGSYVLRFLFDLIDDAG